MYERIWGEFNDTLQRMIAHEKGYGKKEQKKDLICLLKTIKEIYSGLDNLGN